MTQPTQPLILLTNDDGIESPGLAAAAAALNPLGELLIVAPLHQQTSAGRSRPGKVVEGGMMVRKQVRHGKLAWDGYAVDATPAVAVDHGMLELVDRPPALIVSGINYGENVSTCVTVSGTVGAALQGAEYGIPAMAVSVEVKGGDFYTHSTAVDFEAAIHFTRHFAGQMLKSQLPPDVDVLKVEVPRIADENTPWVVTRLDRMMYYEAAFSARTDVFNEPTEIKLVTRKGEYASEGTDAHALAKGLVSVTPLSLDLTSRTDLDALGGLLKV
jgi:5'-nucleotidase